MSSNTIKPKPLNRKPYSGSEEAIVIGIDVGTTFSGVSYALLHPGDVPDIKPVVKFLGCTAGDNKVPSVLYYNGNGNPVAIGAETTKDEVIQEAEINGWLKVEHFKLHFLPPNQNLPMHDLRMELPPHKTPEEVMGDFLRYLVNATSSYVSDAHLVDPGIWRRMKDRATFVIGHPNGWKGRPQERYLRSLILGGLIPDTEEGRKRIRFVTEGEASAMACLAAGIVDSDSLKEGFRFMVADAGGATIDVTTFEVVGSSPLRMKECGLPASRVAGSIFVNRYGNELLERLLENTEYKECIDYFINTPFELATKRNFKGEKDGLLNMGSSFRGKTNSLLNIKAGFLTLRREDLADCFAHSTTSANGAIRDQLAYAGNKTKFVWLVGGFGNNEYLLREIRRELVADGISVQTPDTNLSKAVANGCVLHYLNDDVVIARTYPTTLGTICFKRFNRRLSEHRARVHLVEVERDGLFIGPVFDPIVEKGSPIPAGKIPPHEPYYKTAVSRETAKVKAEILRYDGDLPAPEWYEENKDKFRTLFHVKADLSSLWDSTNVGERRASSLFELLSDSFLSPELLRNSFFPSFRNLKFWIELELGGTMDKAWIKWEENGVPKSGQAEIIHPE